MFDFFKQKKIEGEIGFYNLQDWWMSTFTDSERKTIEEIFNPMGSDSRSKPLTEGKISSSSQNAAGLLHALAGWFNKPEYRPIAKKIIEKAYQEAIKGSKILDLHFTLQQMIEIYYRERDVDPDSLERAIWACREQIKIAPQALLQFKKEDFPPVTHTGYQQLAIILEKQQKLNEAIEICLQAQNQKWNGNWDKRIENIRKKLNSVIKQVNK